MSGINNGGPAFPCCDASQNTSTGETTSHQYVECGLSMRDYFAAKALQAVPMPQGHMHDVPAIYERIASHCYRMADAMLKERAK